MTGWPFPGESPADRARQVALQYRQALWNLDPHTCAAIDQAAVWAGEHWVIAEWAVETAEDWVSVARAAELVGRSKRWVWAWAQENHTAVGHPKRVRLGDVRAAAARRAE